MIYLTRHGQTRFNSEGRIQGRLDSCLTPTGERQAAAMAGLLADMVRVSGPGWRILSSPQGRAMATAAIIAGRLGLPVEADPRLVEVGVGAWEGQRFADLSAADPDRFSSRDWFFRGPGGETYEAAMARVRDWLADQAPEDDRRLIVVSHGATGRLLRGAYAGLSRQATLDQDVPQDAVYRLWCGQVDRLACEPVD